MWVIAGAVVASIKSTRRQREKRAQEAKLEAIDELLNTPIKAEFHGTFGEALEWIQAERGLPVVVRWDLPQPQKV